MACASRGAQTRPAGGQGLQRKPGTEPRELRECFGSKGCFMNQGKWIRSGVLALRFYVNLCIFVYMDVHFPKDRATAFDRFSKDILTF